MVRALAYLGLVCALVATGGSALASAGAGPPPGVEVKVDPAMSAAETTQGWVEERAAKVVAALEPPLDAESIMRVSVRGGAFDYRISVVLLRHGSALSTEEQMREISCACGSSEMLDQVAAALETGAHTLGEAVAREQQAERDAAKAAEAARAAAEELRRQEAERAALESQPRYAPTKLGRAGTGVLGVGGVLAISGIVMAAQPPQQVNGFDVNERSWLAPGYVVLGLGAAAMVSGATLLIVDVVRCRRDRTRCASGAAAWSIDGARSVAIRGGAR